MRGYFRFFVCGFKWAKSGIWGHVGNVSLIAGFALAILAWSMPSWTGTHISERMNAFMIGVIPLLSGASVFLFRWMFLSSYFVYRAEAQKHVEAQSQIDQLNAPQPAVMPYVFAKLQIEAVEQRDCRFRINIQNGPIAVHNVRFRFDTDYYHKAESERVARDVGPNGNLSLPGSHMVLEPGKPNDLIVTVYYDAKTRDVATHYIARFLFPLDKEDFREQIFDPESSKYSQGSPPTREQFDSEQSMILKRDEGTLVFAAEEIWQDKPHIFGQGDPDIRAYAFNAESMCVIFRTTTASGRVKTLRRDFNKTKNGMHLIQLGWNPKGAWLSVDGLRTEDYDP